MPRRAILAAFLCTLASMAIARGQVPPERASKADSRAGFAPLKGAGGLKVDEARISGVPEGTTPVVIDLRRAYRLSLIAGRSGKDRSKQEHDAMLDPGRSAAEADRLKVDDFARFRAEWLGQNADGMEPRFDPSHGFLDLLQRLQAVESATRTAEASNRLLSLYREYVKGSASTGISEMQVDQVAGRLLDDRAAMRDRELEFREGLDAFKLHLGLSPDAPVVLDRSSLDGLRQVSIGVAKWLEREDRETAELDAILARVPKPADLVVDGVSIRDEAAKDDAEAPQGDRVGDESRQGRPGRDAVSVDHPATGEGLPGTRHGDDPDQDLGEKGQHIGGPNHRASAEH